MTLTSRTAAEREQTRWAHQRPTSPESTNTTTDDRARDPQPDNPALTLGAKQWALVAALASTWTASTTELYGVAQATIPDEPSLDFAPWLNQRRRDLARDQARDTQQALEARLRSARQAMEWADRETQRARQFNDEAANLTHTLAIQMTATDLDDARLARYMAAVRSGMTHEDALRHTRIQPAAAGA